MLSKKITLFLGFSKQSKQTFLNFFNILMELLMVYYGFHTISSDFLILEYEIHKKYHFFRNFSTSYLQEYLELEKNKICSRYLLLEIPPNPRSFARFFARFDKLRYHRCIKSVHHHYNQKYRSFYKFDF